MAGTYFTKKDQRFIKQRAKHRCEYCQLLEKYMDCVNEHILAKSRGGTNNLDNIANSCARCNGSKYNKISGYDEMTNKEVPLFNPRIDKWKNHFQWDDEFIKIIGVTSVGRVTVNVLKMNHPKSQDLRKLMRIGKEHPPTE